MADCGCKTPLRMRVHDRSYFFAADKIGHNMSLTHEGFLLCEGVPIARTGEQLYGPDETPLKVGKDGAVHVQRDADEVFRPETMASFEGKDIVDEHPEEGVSPDNWRELSVGHAQNIRKGTGADEGYLLADFVIKDPDAIAAVREGKREVSCGYDCEYEQTGDGQGRQYNIVGNHIALVERGRCGPRCSIRDHSPKEITTMPKKLTVRDRLKRELGVSTDAEFEAALNRQEGDDEAPEAPASSGSGAVEIHNHIHMPGEAPLVGTGDEPEPEPDPAAAAELGAGEGEGSELDTADLPPWFLEHVAQNNARFDRLEALLSGGNEPGEGEGEEAPADAEDPEIEAEINDAANIEGFEAPPGTGDGEEEVPGMDGAEEEEEVAGSDGVAEEEEEEAANDADLAPPGKTGDAAARAKAAKAAKAKALKARSRKRSGVRDSVALEDSYQETVSIAETLVPGITLFTFDAAAPLKSTFDQICKLRRRVLDKAYHDGETKPMIDAVNGNRPLRLAKLSCGDVRVLYRAVGAMKKQANDSSVVVVPNNGAGGGLGVSETRKVRSIADLNRLNEKAYSSANS